MQDIIIFTNHWFLNDAITFNNNFEIKITEAVLKQCKNDKQRVIEGLPKLRLKCYFLSLIVIYFL